MPSPPHPCAYPGCMTMVARKEATHCRKHAIKPPGHAERVAEARRGKPLSVSHRRRISEAKTKRIEAKCEQCGKVFTAKPSRMQRFCSRTCGYANRSGERAPNWRADMPTVQCRICGSPFRIEARTRRAQRLTCSYTCRNIWRLTRQKTKGTNIERIMENAITKRGIAYESQVPLCNVTIADFYLSDRKIAIFCDGDYWHGKPEHLARDGRQTAVLQAAGYTVHRFLGSEIMSDIDACLERMG